MNKQVLAVIVGVIIVLVLGYFVWRLISSQFAGGSNSNESNEKATSEQIAEVIDSVVLTEDAQIVLGQTVSIDRNRVVSQITDSIYWVAPMGGDKSLVLINSSEVEIAADNIISFSGQAKNIKDFGENSAGWTLTRGDLETINNYPLIVDASTIEIVD